MSTVGLMNAALGEVAAYKGRTVLSIMSVVVGIASITLIVAVGEVGRAAAVAALERQSGRSATVNVGLVVSSSAQLDAYGIASQLSETAKLNGATASAVASSVGGSVSTQSAERPTQIVGTQPDLAIIRRFRIVSGRWIIASDQQRLAPSIVLNKPLAADLGVVLATDSVLNATMRVGQDVSGVIVGIVDDGQPTSVAYVALPVLREWALENPTPSLLIWAPPNRVGSILNRASWVASQLSTRIEAQRTDNPEAVDEFIRLIQAILAGIAALSLVSGGIGIINLGLVTAGQRAQEFAIRRAFGATRTTIFAMVCIESALTVTIAGVVGIAIAAGGTAALSALASASIGVDDLPPFPVSAALLGALVSIALALGAGLAPARAATGKSIIRGIRD